MRSQRNTAAHLRPLTPELPEPKESGKLTHAQLTLEVFSLRKLLAAERKRHAQIEGATAKYLSILEANIAAGQASLAAAREAYFATCRLPISEKR
jgi:hypothetical protein